MSEPDQPETPPAAPPPPPMAPPPPAGGYPPPQYGAYPGGYPPAQPYAGGTPPPAAPSNGLGIASLVTAIIALLSVVGGVVLGIVAVVLGFMGWGRAKRGQATNGGIAIAGIVLGFLSIIEAVVVIGVAIWGFQEAGGSDYIDCLSRAGSDPEAMQQCADKFTEHLEDQFSITVTPTP